MARVDTAPEDRDEVDAPTIEQVVECEDCELEFTVRFPTPEGVEDMEDIEEPDALKLEGYPCPGCGFEQDFTYEGWTVRGDAG